MSNVWLCVMMVIFPPVRPSVSNYYRNWPHLWGGVFAFTAADEQRCVSVDWWCVDVEGVYVWCAPLSHNFSIILLIIQCHVCFEIKEEVNFYFLVLFSVALVMEYILQGCQSSAFRRNSAFFFYFPLFSKLFSSFFEKSQQKKCFFVTDAATIESSNIFGKQSMTSWFAGFRFRFPV